MALDRSNRYPGRFENPTTEQPQGAFKNRTSPTAEDGSYFEADWANDMSGFFGAILSNAGVSPNGSVDTASSSQVYDALKTLFPLAAGFTGSLSSSGYVQIPLKISGASRILKINWAPWSGTTGSTDTNGIYETSGIPITWASPFSTSTYGVIASVNDVSGSGLQEMVWRSGMTLTGCSLLASCRQASTAMSGFVIGIGS